MSKDVYDRFLDSNYKKKSVEEIHKSHDGGNPIFTSDFLKKYEDSRVLEPAKEKLGDMFPDEGQHGHDNVARSLLFAQALAKAMPIYSFQFDNQSSNRGKKMWIFRDDYPYSVGQLGYGDFCTTVTPTDSEYMVSAFTISNLKYDVYSEQHYMARSIHMDKSVKNALKYLRPPSSDACAKYNGFKARRHFQDIGNDMHQKQRGLLANLTEDHGALLVEFRNMISTDYAFINKEFGDRISNWIKAHDENNARQQKTLNMFYVRIYKEDDIQLFDVIPMHNVNKDVHACIKEGSLVTYTESDVPEEIMGKISVLSMVKSGEYVDDVGYRDEAGCFYITQ